MKSVCVKVNYALRPQLHSKKTQVGRCWGHKR